MTSPIVPPNIAAPIFKTTVPIAVLIPNATVVEPTRDIGVSRNQWWRIEPVPLSSDITPGLQALVADPLWMLCRQWQFVEFAGEDAGTPIQVNVQGEVTPLTRFSPGPVDKDSATRARAYSTDTLPLETAVEREPVLSRHPRFVAEAGQHLARMLLAIGGATVRDAVLKAYPLTLPAPTDAGTDTYGNDWYLLAQGRVIDAVRFAAALATARGTAATITAPPAGVTLSSTIKTKALDVFNRWLAWFHDSVVEPDAGDAWNPRRLEYAFSAGGVSGQTEVVLGADQYADGTFDWYSVDGEAQTLGSSTTAAVTPLVIPPTMPSPVEYAGKPADRLWEFEDANINFGIVDAGPTDLARMALIEFSLVYGNDWFVVPVTLPVGSVFRTTIFTVRDTFGVQTIVNPSKNTGTLPWSVFSLGGSRVPDGAFFLAPTLVDPLEGAPLEEVALFRDEMANMAWGVERRVQGAAGDAYNRTYDEIQRASQQQVSGPPVDAQLIYRLATSVPENWIPLVPVTADGSTPANPVIQLQRRVLLRTTADGSSYASQPRGILLRSDLTQSADTEPALRIEEEEVPREGTVVTRSFQFGRWFDGRSILWVGKRKQVGRGEGASGLRFDTSDPS
ncbi:MAG TPA: hypothetical protein VGM82_00665 [Gemmatimonadaceae bacterium]|jgi:hypothetical protein